LLTGYIIYVSKESDAVRYILLLNESKLLLIMESRTSEKVLWTRNWHQMG